MLDLDKLDKEPFDPSSVYVPVLKEEPVRFDSSAGSNTDNIIFDLFCLGAAERGASDITVQSDRPIKIQINSQQHHATRRPLLASEVEMMLAHIWRSTDAAGIIRQGRALDFSYEVRVDRRHRQRYRVNACGIMVDGTEGVEITMRVLPRTTPTLDDVKLEEEVRPYLSPQSGIIVIAGGTGHGKSTTMAAITRHHLENPEMWRKVIDLQAPIEFDYPDIHWRSDKSASFISQSEIGEGRNMPNFGAGVWTALRRAPAIINVGEARDVASMAGAIEACLTGHIVNTTTHSGSIAEGLRRMAITFPAGEQEARAFDLISSLQLFIVQRLLRTGDERGRVAVREFLLFDDEVRDRFLNKPINDWSAIVADLLQQSQTDSRIVGRPMAVSLRNLVKAGTISEAEAKRFMPRAMMEF